jgi:heme/copper-type cytochrome/quinol oxidase subunit 1
MDQYAKAFVRSSLIYLGIGTMIGIGMVLWPDVRFTLTRVHVHILLLGFMAMMIYGVGYHILPRFMGRPVYSARLGNAQLWLANITLIGLCLSWILEAFQGGIWHNFAILFGIGQTVSIFLFIINLWMSMVPQTTE